MAFRKARQNHPGVESAIGAMQAGNGLERCRDKTDRGYERFVGLGLLGRNLHTCWEKAALGPRRWHCVKRPSHGGRKPAKRHWAGKPDQSSVPGGNAVGSQRLLGQDTL